MKATKSTIAEMLSRSSWPDKDAGETEHQKQKKQTVRERVRQHIQEDEAGFHCHIVGDSTCQYVQKKLRPDNFVRHFRDRHEFEAKEKGFQEDDDEEEEEQTGSELVEAVKCPVDVKSDPMAELRNQFPNMNIFNINGVRRDWYKKLVRPWILEDEKGAHCRILDDTSCRYTQKTLRLQNFLRHFRSLHEQEAREKGLFWDEYKDYAYTDNSEIGQGLEQNIQNESQDEKKRRKNWYQIVKHCLLEDEKGIHCQIVEGDSICNYTQKTLRMQNMMRHIRIKHKQEAKDMGFLEDDPEPSTTGLSQNATEDLLVGEIESLKTEVQDSLLEEVLAEHDTQMLNCGSALGDHVSSKNKGSFKRSRKSRKKDGLTKTRRLMKFILQDQAGSHCRILDDLSCPYTQKTLHVQNFLRHFRSAHPAASRQNGFFWRSKEIRIPKEPPTESSAHESDGDGQEREMVASCIKMEEFNVVERGLAQVDDDERIRCIIEPDSPCQYRQDCYDEVRFLAHFRLKHSYLGDVLFPGDGLAIPDQVDHAVVGEDGIFCQKEPDSGCDYFQTSYNEKKFRQHFRAKHSDQDEKEELPEKPGDIYRKLIQFIYEDDLGIHCRITDDTRCEYVQQTRQLQLFLRHFLLSHRKEARQKGLLTNPQSQLLKSIIPRYDRKGRIIIYQSYHLKKHGLVQAQDDGFRCSQEPCDFVRDTYDESTFLEHLRQNHPTVFEGLKPSKQRLTFKVDEHVLQDEGGFHCRIAGPFVCNYVQRQFRMQNFFRHFYIRHRADFDRTGFVLHHVNSYGTAKVQDLLENCGVEESDVDGEPSAAERSITNCDTFMDLELSVDQASHDEEEVSGFRHQPDSVPSVTKMQWCAQRAKIDELIKVDDQGTFCCNISKKSGCDFVMSFFNRQPFAKHFRTKHPEEAKRHGFFDQFNLKRSKNANNPKPMVGEFVALDEQGFRCNINGKSRCDYVRKRLQEKAFLKHFNVRHPEEAKRYGLYDLVAKSRARVRNGKRKKFFIHMVRENVMADSRGIHCRIADPLCDYVQEIFRPQNFQRHFIGKHPKEAMAKGFVAAEPEPEEQESTTGDESDDEALANPAEYCRLCSSTVQPLEPIFKKLENIGNSLAPLIERFTGITLTVESDNSAHICEKCHQRLKNNQRFSQRCQSFDRKVRRKKKIVLPEPVCCSPPPLVPYNLDIVPVAVRPSVPFIGVESHGDGIGSSEQDMIPLDIIKTEETVVEGMEQDPFVSGGSSGLEKVANVENELPYARVLNMLKCGHCELVCHTVAGMVDHCREVHGVQADDGR